MKKLILFLLLACPLFADRVFDGVDDQIDAAFVISTTPFTLAFEARPDSIAAGDQSVVAINNTAGNRTASAGRDTDDEETVLSDATSGSCATKTTTPLFTTTAYFRGASIFINGNDVTACLNGTCVAATGQGCTVPTFNDLTIGNDAGSGSIGLFAGAISKVCVWNVALAQGELAPFFQGAGCQKIRPANLCVIDIHGTTTHDVTCAGDLGTGWGGTITGTTTQAARGGSKAK